jgi:hypothetical protein
MSRGASMIKNWSIYDQVAHLAEITTRRHWAIVHLSLVDQISLNPILLGLISNIVSTEDLIEIECILGNLHATF